MALMQQEEVKSEEEVYRELMKATLKKPTTPVKTEEEVYQELMKPKESFLKRFGREAWAGVKTLVETPAAMMSPIWEFPASLAVTLYKQAVNPEMSWQEAKQIGDEFAHKTGFQPGMPVAQLAKQWLVPTLTITHPQVMIPILLAHEGIKVAAEDDPEVEAMLETGLFSLVALGGSKVMLKPKAAIAKSGKIMADIGGEFSKRVFKGKEATKLWKSQAPPPTDAVANVIKAVEEYKPLRKEQKALYAAEKGKRLARSIEIRTKIGGEAGARASMAALKGELPTVEVSPESLRAKISQVDIDSLYNQVDKSRMLTEWERPSAIDGLNRLFTRETAEFKMPQPKQLVLLNRVFPKELTQAIMGQRTRWQKIMGGLWETANIPRAVMASWDLSAPMRQGLFLISEPKEFFNAFKNMFKYWGSDKAYRGLMEYISQHPRYQQARAGNLVLTEMDSVLSLAEEPFMSHFAEKIPGVRRASRAHTGFLNKLRFDVFVKMVERAESEGLYKTKEGKPFKNLQLTNDIAHFINAASGRGKLLKHLEPHAVALNTTLFSPRLMASRMTLLNPIYYIKAKPLIRRQALKSLISMVGVGSAALTLAKAAGWETGTNLFSADFGKIKVGNTRIDVWGGFQQYARTAFQLFGSKTVSATTGKVTKVGEGYPPLSHLDIMGRWLEYKAAPIVSFALGLAKGRTVDYEKFEIPKEVLNRFTPMVIQDLIDIAKDDPSALPAGALGIFGVGIQTYKPGKKKGTIGDW